ncbi:MAG: hypothetical protein ACK4S3_04085 [Parvibaculum sp.]|jgi:hypothetical protein|uniref:hypothetical protein n=1 Tax=Parvibaculum sp. TaxID=2024848 RepID=UPI0034877964
MKIRFAGAVLAAAFILAGCQTTGAGTQAAMAGAGAMAAPSAYAPIASSQPNDGAKSCDELLAEIAEMEQIAAAAAQSESNAAMTDTGIGIAQSLGVHFGGGSGMLAAYQASGAASQLTQQQREQAKQRAQQAEVRRQVLSGIYQGKGCAA